MDLNLSCKCNKVQGIARAVEKVPANRAVCMCDDCQAFAKYLGTEGVLDENGGTEVVPLFPSHIEIIKGKEHLTCVRLYRNGLYRWYTECCRTPVANIPKDPKLPYAGVNHAFFEGDSKKLQEALGPVQMRVMGKYGHGKLPPGTYEKFPIGKIIFSILPFIIRGKILKKYTPSPFFDDNGNPKATPIVLNLNQPQK